MGIESISMFRCGFSFLFCVVGIPCICLSCAGSFHTIKCVETERQALLKFKDALILPKHALSSWNTGEDCCKWEGISCDNLTGHVTSFDLREYAEGGKLDSSICELQHLTSLNLTWNGLKGKIPKCIGSFSQLIELKLGSNEFVGVIPPTLANLSKLKTLDLGWNDHLVSNDLEWISHLSNLRYLNMSYVNLSLAVDWLSSINKIPTLMEFCLNDCGLHQVDPQFILHSNSSTSLKVLDLGGNNLNSSILSWVISVSKVLRYLDLWNNSLQHSIPDAIGNMISLQYLDLSYNELEGSIPKSFKNLCQLKGLWLDTNKLSGQLNDNIRHLSCAQNGLQWLGLSNNPFSSAPLLDFSSFSSLMELNLRNTNIVGPFPQSIGHLPPLTTLDLSFNQLSGSQPLHEVAKLASLELLDLSYNQLNGPLPYTIGQLSNLTDLFLSSNKLNGVISEAHLSNLSRLRRLDLAYSLLSFNLSSNWVPPFQLHVLYASSCILGPKFPKWLKHQRRLMMLQISNSSILDSLPEWFWDLSSNLVYLNVSHNNLSGVLPKSIPNFKSKYPGAWDFSFNNLSGPLPPFPGLYALFLSNNMFSGYVHSFCASSTLSLAYLDLSSNLLAGPLPDCWEKFQPLQYLNLEKNNLSGNLPDSFGTLQQIQSLHLNNNNFSGEIPSLTLCRSLTLIDVGDNNLQGILPAWIGHHLHRLIILRLQANKFRGSIPISLCNLSILQVLDVSKNNITGEIPQCLNHITALSDIKFPRKSMLYSPLAAQYAGYDDGPFSDELMLVWKGANREYGKILGLMTTIDLSCNHLTGEIPQSVTKLVALAGLNLSGNNLTGFIPNEIGHMEMLESLDLSGNHLHGRMPTSFTNLTFLSYMNLSFNNLSGKIPMSTQLQSFDVTTYEGNSGLCGPPLTNHCPWDVISPIGNPVKHENYEDEDELITFGFYISLGFGFCVGFWGICGTLVIKPSRRHSYFQFFNNMSDWIHVTVIVSTARMKRRFQVHD